MLSSGRSPSDSVLCYNSSGRFQVRLTVLPTLDDPVDVVEDRQDHALRDIWRRSLADPVIQLVELTFGFGVKWMRPVMNGRPT